ncbi:unnamed protein product [Caenorhabditis angaria]|uniref:Uncharacterized protein n=1 Tax=Caenorhabditis angaria TaxID=860376 RepID=A0A9P1I968_9PELO|nr:unnamed protein product [Caenorhabditis angaria]
MFSSRFGLFATVCLIFAMNAYWGQVQAAVLPVSSTEVALVEESKSGELATTESTTAIDTLGSSRVKRSGCGCGCGCGCCCCRPRCCCCCRRCCTCCRTCCCTRCCTCCRPCCCGCGCGCGCGGGCGCCGCGGGGRKRRSLQNLKIDHANRQLGIKRKSGGQGAAAAKC